MKPYHADVTIHVDETLDAGQLLDLEEQMRANYGVIDVRYRLDRPHLLVADYDPEALRAIDLLQIVQGSNLHGELIGL